jgi:Mg2+ and Co2+ transporter CorA
MYIVKGKDFIATDVSSLSQLMNVASDHWVWLDIFHPDEKELEILTELLGNEPDVIKKFNKMMEEPLNIHNKGCILCNYERIHEYISVTIPYLGMGKQMPVYPIVLAKKKRMIITWGEEEHSHSKIVKTTIRRLREGVEAGQDLNSSLVIGVLFHEIAIRNAGCLFGIRERIDEMEEQALESGGKHLIHDVFLLKKKISDLYRLLIEEKDFMLDVDKSVIPFIRLDQKSKPIVNEAIEILDRELDFMDSYNRTLDSILTLQDLASIHKVESSINYLTIVLVIGTVILIFFELLNILEFA